MTVIAAYMDSEHCVIGCDSMASTQYVKYNVGSKLIEKGGCTVGVCGDLRTLDLILEDNQLPEVFSIEDCRRFRDRLIDLTADIKHYMSAVLIASPRGIYGIEADFSLFRGDIDLGYTAFGSGEELALGSMYCSRKMDDPATLAVETAIEAATSYSKSCGFDIYIKTYEVEQ
jgi:hypothetical protein